MYDYNRELVHPDINVLQWISDWFRELLRSWVNNSDVVKYSDVILFAIAIMMLMAIIWFLYRRKPALFVSSSKLSMPYEVLEDTIYGIDFEEAIKLAEAKKNYEEVIRLLYLQTLSKLSNEERINWQPYKTPTQYIYEVRDNSFRNLTHIFLRVRYGNYKAGEELVETMRCLQFEVEKGGRS